mgnify:CR=1 FL=1
MNSFDSNFPGEAMPKEELGTGEHPGKVLLHAVARYPMTIVMVAGLCATVALVRAFSEPNSYKSVGMLLLRMGAREQHSAESLMDPSLQGDVRTFATEDELLMLSDPSLQERVVKAVGVERILRPYDPSGDREEPFVLRKLHEFQSWWMLSQSGSEFNPDAMQSSAALEAAIEIVANGTHIDAEPRGNTIVVEVTVHDTQLAQLIAKSYMNVCQERHREFYETENSFSFVSERLREANEAANSARAALLARQEEDGIYNLATRQQARGDEIRQLEAQNNQDKIRLYSIEKQLVVTEEQLKGAQRWISPPYENTSLELPPKPGTEEPKEVESPENAMPLPGTTIKKDPRQVFAILTVLTADRRELTNKLSDLGRIYVKTSPQYIAEAAPLQQKLSELDEQIQIASSTGITEVNPAGANIIFEPAGPNMELNPDFTALSTKSLDFTREKQALLASMDARDKVLKQNYLELAKLKTLEGEHGRLARAAERAEQRASNMETAHSQSQTLQMIDSDERISSLLVTQEPFLPTDKEGPNRVKSTLFGLIGGLVAGLALALIRQVSDSRLRYSAQVENALGLPVLGVIPEERSWRRVGRTLKSQYRKPA